MSKANDAKSIGGFVSINFGRIINSYSTCKLPKRKGLGSFCFKNEGQIYQCFSSGGGKRKCLNQFVFQNLGDITNSFNDKKKSKGSVSDEQPGIHACDFNTLTIKGIEEHHNIDLKDIWEQSDDKKFLSNIQFDPKKIFCDVSQLYSDETVIEIRTPQQLQSISKKINMGDKEYANASYVLKRNINLKGKSWDPIGNDTYPFAGVFDGGGYKVFNFKVDNKELLFSGFFGCIKEAIVANLNIDGIIKRGSYVGTFAGVNDGGKVYCCSAVSHAEANKCTGGFIGKNTGDVAMCYYSGKIKKKVSYKFPVFISLALFSGLIYFISLNPFKNTSLFNNVPIDPYAVRKNELSLVNQGENRVSFDFSDTIKFFNGKGDFDLSNPASANQDIVLQLQITDQELLNKIGTTGRKRSEQEALSKMPEYNPENARVTICSSGTVPPGYDLPSLRLDRLPNGSALPNGVYKGIIFMSFYKTDTKEKAIVNSQAPVLIIIE